MLMMDTLTILIAAGGIVAYLDQCIRPLLAKPPEVVTETKIVPLETTFICHYCGRRYPIAEQEKFGSYVYCKEHGRARQLAVPSNGRPQPPRPQVKIVQRPLGEKMPWEK